MHKMPSPAQLIPEVILSQRLSPHCRGRFRYALPYRSNPITWFSSTWCLSFLPREAFLRLNPLSSVFMVLWSPWTLWLNKSVFATTETNTISICTDCQLIKSRSEERGFRPTIFGKVGKTKYNSLNRALLTQCVESLTRLT